MTPVNTDTKTYSAGSLLRHYHAAKTWEPEAPFVRVDWCTVLTAQEWLRCYGEQVAPAPSLPCETCGGLPCLEQCARP